MNKKSLAMLSAFILVFGVAFSGCGQKVVYEKPKTTESGKIKINGYEDIPDGSEIVIGDDGQSYLVDGEGNSVIYEAPTYSQIPGTSFTTSTTGPTTTTTKKKDPPTTTTTTTTLSEIDNVKKILSENRGTGEKFISAFANSNQNRLGIKFSDSDTDWLVELHKGSYGNTTIGCEMGIYTRNDGTFKKISDSEKVIGSVELYDKVAERNVITIGAQSRNIGWIYGLKEGTLPNSSASNLAMVCKISFPSMKLADAFMDSLEENGFSENDVSHNTNNRFSCDESGKNVSFVW